jgi:hypothetical protein
MPTCGKTGPKPARSALWRWKNSNETEETMAKIENHKYSIEV